MAGEDGRRRRVRRECVVVTGVEGDRVVGHVAVVVVGGEDGRRRSPESVSLRREWFGVPAPIWAWSSFHPVPSNGCVE